MKYNTFIFDMDGVMIDSEPFWQMAQQQALAKHDIMVTTQDCEKYTMGKRIDHVAIVWCTLFSLNIDPKKLEKDIIDQVVLSIQKNGTAIKGLDELLMYLQINNYKIGLATSSNWRIIDAVLNKLNVKSYFQEICSADDESYGKPNPGVYLSAAKKLKSKLDECIVLEDSVTGMIAAKAAMMKTVILTDDVNNPKFAIADKHCASHQDVILFLKTL